ncbi:Cna B-type domain-containing protein [Enterococcus gilvus]|uniref:Cna B-type domain-containing protein n=1 Tax=Enterococcus gilvus TaxID=160453 RepID=UPI00345EAB4B
MKKILSILVMSFGFFCFSYSAEATDISTQNTEPLKNIRTDIDLKNNKDVQLKNLNLLWHSLETIVDDSKNLYFCLDEGKYYPNGNDYVVDMNRKIPGSILWLMETFYVNQNSHNDVTNVPEYKDANELTRYAAIQLAIWKIDGGNFDNKIVDSNPLINNLIEEAKKQKDNSISYQDMIDKINKLEMNISDTIQNGESESTYNYLIKLDSNVDEETEQLFQLEDVDVDIQISKNNKLQSITDDSTVKKNIKMKEIEVEVPKELIDHDKAEDTVIYFDVTSKIITKNPYYLVYTTGGFYQSLGGYHFISKNLFARSSIDLDLSDTDYSVFKDWDDKNNQDGMRPKELIVQLYQSDQPYTHIGNESITTGTEKKTGEAEYLNEQNNWKYIWNKLPVHDSRGNKIYYVAREENVSNYERTIHSMDSGKGIILKNTYEPEIISLNGQKRWEDHNNQDGKRPESIIVNLLADGKIIQEKKVTEKDNWIYEFKNLPKYQNGQEIIYTIDEQSVENYKKEVDGFNLINHYTPELVLISGEKKWEDHNNQDGKRPESIIVNLLADGKIIQEKKVTEKDNWIYEFKDLPKYQNGQEITYTIDEQLVENYKKEVEGFNLINHYTPKKTAVSVLKKWEDQNDFDKIRPQSIKVQLSADNKPIGETITLNEKNNWTYQWNDLNESNNGKIIEYTVNEIDVPKGYSVSVVKENSNTFVITNRYRPKEIITNNNDSDVQNSSSYSQNLSSAENDKSIPSFGEKNTVELTLLGAVVLLSAIGIFYYKNKL